MFADLFGAECLYRKICNYCYNTAGHLWSWASRYA